MEWLLDYASSPYHRGACSASSLRHTLTSQSCADCVTLQIVLEETLIQQAWHLSQGCLVSQSAVSFLCEWCEGKTIQEVLATEEGDYLKLLGNLTPMRQQCALLSFRCLQQCVRDDLDRGPC